VRRRFSKLASVLLVFFQCLYFTGCAQLPYFAQPHVSNQPFDPDLEFFGYRQLDVEDFKATRPSSTIIDHKEMINAHTSLSLRPVHDIRYVISLPHQNFGLYKVYLQELHFRAVMIPERSWWNPQLSSTKTSYVLQHEQIHFALMEISARRLNKKLAGIPGGVISAPDARSLELLIKETVDKEIEISKKLMLKEHTAFDEDTSLYHDPQQQQKWYDQCIKELAELQQWQR
jgi:hypothetical protein